MASDINYKKHLLRLISHALDGHEYALEHVLEVEPVRVNIDKMPKNLLKYYNKYIPVLGGLSGCYTIGDLLKMAGIVKKNNNVILIGSIFNMIITDDEKELLADCFKVAGTPYI